MNRRSVGRRRLLPLAVLAAAATLLTSAPGRTAAATTGCGPNDPIGTRLPVLFVHGYNSSAKTWSPATLHRFCTARTYSTTFDYGPVSNEWVDNPQIGPALAGEILNLAHASQRDGGPGKVLVVAHSMGGLAVRCAADGRCAGSVAGAPAGQANIVARSLAAVVTFDTPNTGTFQRGHGASLVSDTLGGLVSGLCYAGQVGTYGQDELANQWCDEERTLTTSQAARGFTPGSAALKALPGQPRGIPVMAVAGRDYVHLHLLFLTLNLTTGDPGDEDSGDLIVSRASALQQNARIDGIGGTRTIDCGTLNIGATMNWTGVSCWHVKETNDSRWLDSVQGTIDAWFAAHPPAAATPPPSNDIIRFDGIGALNLSMTSIQLLAMGYHNDGNIYEGQNAQCVSYGKQGQPGASVDTTTGKILAIKGASSKARTAVGGIHVGSTLAQIRAAFPGMKFRNYFNRDFGQGADGIVVSNGSGDIAFGLIANSDADFASGAATVNYLPGVGTPGHAPTATEIGC